MFQLKMEHILGVAEKRYGIFTLGSKSVIGRMLPRDTDITVIFNGKSYPAHTHKTSGGRIDRLSALLNLNYIHVNTLLLYEYNVEKKNCMFLCRNRKCPNFYYPYSLLLKEYGFSIVIQILLTKYSLRCSSAPQVPLTYYPSLCQK